MFHGFRTARFNFINIGLVHHDDKNMKENSDIENPRSYQIRVNHGSLFVAARTRKNRSLFVRNLRLIRLRGGTLISKVSVNFKCKLSRLFEKELFLSVMSFCTLLCMNGC